MIISSFKISHHLHVSFLSRVNMNSTNWPAPDVSVFIGQTVEHCSVNAGAMRSNPIEVPNFFFFFWGGGVFAIA